MMSVTAPLTQGPGGDHGFREGTERSFKLETKNEPRFHP